MAKAIGSIAWKNGKWLNGDIMSIEEEEGDDMFLRYETDAIRGIMQPLIKYNKRMKRCYFLTDRSANGRISWPEYDTKGYPCKVDIWRK
jgi:hypothetical protein